MTRRREAREAPTVEEGAPIDSSPTTRPVRADARAAWRRRTVAESTERQSPTAIHPPCVLGARCKVADVGRPGYRSNVLGKEDRERRATQPDRRLSLLGCSTSFGNVGVAPAALEPRPGRRAEPARNPGTGSSPPSDITASSRRRLARRRRAARPPSAAIRFAMVTGLRIGEVLAIRWEHVEPETGRLILPETKTGPTGA